MNTHRDGFRVRPAWVRHRRFLILALLALLLLLISGAAPARADGLRIGYHDGKWAVSARFTSPRAAWCAPSPGWQWNFRCAPGLVTRPYYPAYYSGYTHGSWYNYGSWYNDSYTYQGDVTDYYGLRLNRAPLENAAAATVPATSAVPAEPVNADAAAVAPTPLDPEAELARVLEEFSSQRTPLVMLHNEAGEEEAELPLNPRVQVPESLPYLANLPEVELTTAMPRVR